MTRDEAIGKWIYPAIATIWDTKRCKEILEALEQEPCEDCISRREAEDNVCRMRNDKEFYMQYADTVEDGKQFGRAVERMIYAMPSVVSQPKTGHWIEQDGFDGDTYYDCSECGESFCLIEGTPTDNLYNYCPNCGAKMESEGKAESEE